MTSTTETRAAFTPPAETPHKPIHVTLPRDMFRRAILAASKAASRDDMVPALETVLVDVDADRNTVTVAATDRYRLHVVTVNADPDGRAEYGADVTYPGRFMLPARDAAAMVKGWREPRGYSLPYPLTIVGPASVTPSDGPIRFEHFDGSREIRPWVGGEFPSYRQLIPSWIEEPDARQNPGAGMVGVNPFYLADALTACATAFGETARNAYAPAIMFTGKDTTGAPSPTRPIVVARGNLPGPASGRGVGADTDPITFRALVMPVRLEGQER